jgi:hypothetical protein
MRIDYENREALDRARATAGQYILAFWHSRFVMMPYAHPRGRIVVLTSRHRDAQRLVRILDRLGIETVHGSSSDGGAAGLREMLHRVREGCHVGLTPDGPRGPRRRAKPGVVAAARLSGLPIIPVAFSARPARRLRSWDRTLLPCPWSRGLFVYGDPIHVARRADEQERQRLLARVESEINRVTDLADREVGIATE